MTLPILSQTRLHQGSVNDMAEDCSHLWHLSDSQLLAYFNRYYLQTIPWKLVTLRSKINSALTSALQRQRPLPQSFLGELVPRMVTGEFGKCSLPLLKESTPISLNSRHPSSYIFSKYSQHAYDVDSLHPVVTLSDLGKWKTTYVLLARRSLAWTTQILT